MCECVNVHASTLHVCETFDHVCSISYITSLNYYPFWTEILSSFQDLKLSEHWFWEYGSPGISSCVAELKHPTILRHCVTENQQDPLTPLYSTTYQKTRILNKLSFHTSYNVRKFQNSPDQNSIYIITLSLERGHTVAQLVEALRYKPEGCELDSLWCHWNFSLTYSLKPHYGPGISSSSNRNEYQEYFLGVKAASA
jgi:hypothetical protein